MKVRTPARAMAKRAQRFAKPESSVNNAKATITLDKQNNSAQFYFTANSNVARNSSNCETVKNHKLTNLVHSTESQGNDMSPLAHHIYGATRTADKF